MKCLTTLGGAAHGVDPTMLLHGERREFLQLMQNSHCGVDDPDDRMRISWVASDAYVAQFNSREGTMPLRE